jgi:hypothetical protein
MTVRERPPAALRERLLTATAQAPATPPGTWRRRVMASAALAFGWMAAIIAVKGLRLDWDDLPVGSLAATIVALVGVAIGLSLLALARGRAMVGTATTALSIAVWGSLIVLFALVLALDPHGPSTRQFPAMQPTVSHAAACGLMVGIVGAPLLGFGLMATRGLTIARPALTGACLGLGVATWAHAIVRVHCAVGGSGHAILGHLLPALPLMALGVWGLRGMQRRSARR